MRRYSNMAVKSEKIDYKLSCRCCLKADAEFYKLDSYMIEDLKDRKVSLLQCLIYSICREDMPELPKYICTGCSRALHIAHTFVQTAQEAHDILCQKLYPGRFISKVDKKHEDEKRASCNNGWRALDATQAIDGKIHKKEDEIQDTAKLLRYRCKVCGEKVHTEIALKEHVRKHMDLITYRCQICNYDTRVLRKIKQHYRTEHNMDPTAQQLYTKAQKSISPIKSEHLCQIMQPPAQSSPTEVSTACTLEDMELLIPAAITSKELEERRQTELHNEELKQQQIQSRLKGRPKKIAPKRKRSISQSLANEQIDSQIIEPICQPISPESLQMATVITDPNNLTALTTALPQFEMNTVALTNELSVGAEFVVKSDGSVEQVMGNGVVIEYINAIPAEDNIYGNDILSSEDLNGISTKISSAIDSNEVVEHMNIEDIIVEETGIEQPMTTAALIRMNLKKGLTSEIDPRRTRHRCNECGKVFSTLNRLRNHLLSHKNLPRYFCDLCSFYTLIGSDLMRHYEASHHKDGPNKKKPKLVPPSCNTYACDLCLFDTHNPIQLKQHYQIRHKLEPTDVQLRSNIHDVTVHETLKVNKNVSEKPIETQPDYKDGLMCAMCPEVFYFRHKYKEHLRQHVLADTVGLGQRKQMSPLKTSLAPSNVVKVEQFPMDPTETLSFVNLPDAGAVTVEHLPTTTTKFSLSGATKSDVNSVVKITEIDNTKSAATILTTGCLENLLPTEDMATKVVNEVKPAATLTEITSNLATVGNQPKSTSMIGDMQDFIDSTDVAAICTIPADAIQVVESDDIVIDSNIDFSFTFEDFDEDDDDEEEDDDDDDDDENKNNDAVIDQNLLLTSDDDDLDDFDDEQSKYLQKPYCMFCHKKFTSQYQFENHMFLHRGLAPYRCEMCTNLYNKKRALLRHYKSVHKRMPTRDMVQARGDKVAVDRTPIETLIIDEQQVLTLMCAKCPYESVDRTEMILHLKNHHDVDDQHYIISKLPYECPRCIRSYVTKGSLVRHLQRSHLVATIIEQTTETSTSAAPTKTTTSMPMTTNPAFQSSARTTPKDNCSGGCRNIRSQEGECGESEELEIVDFQIDGGTYDSNGNHNEKHTVTGTNNYEIDSNAVALESLFDFEYNFMGSGDVNEQVVTARMAPAVMERSQETLRISPTDLARPTTTNMEMSAAEAMSHVTHINNSFQCGICNSTYGSLSLLKCHMKRHISRNFYCEQCKKSFVTRAELERHKPVHDATKQSCFKCEEPGCEKVFTYKHHLKRHQDVAHLLKRFLCPLESCFRQFTTNTQFKRHMLCHKGAQFPYKCSACQKRFSRRKVLQRHALKKHKIDLSENDIAEIYRSNVGHTNPCDMKFYNFNDVQLECLFVTSEKVSVVSEPPEDQMLDMPLQCSATEAAKAVVNILST